MRVGVEIGNMMMMMMMIYANHFCQNKNKNRNEPPINFSSFFIHSTDPIKHATIVRHEIGCKQASK